MWIGELIQAIKLSGERMDKKLLTFLYGMIRPAYLPLRVIKPQIKACKFGYVRCLAGWQRNYLMKVVAVVVV